MTPENPYAYSIPSSEPYRVKRLADGSLKFLHRGGKWMIARPGTWLRKVTGEYNIMQYEYIRLVYLSYA